MEVFERVDATSEDVRSLIARHRDLTREATPAEFRHSLSSEQVVEWSIDLYGLRVDGALVAIGGLRRLSDTEVELKSMHTLAESRGRGFGGRVLDELIAVARRQRYATLLLETGTNEPFAPARSLYASRGFEPVGSFGDYEMSPWNTFMALRLVAGETSSEPGSD